MPVDGTFPVATTQWEKRNIALEIPVWDEALCIQCGKCVLVCPHGVIRAKVYDDPLLKELATETATRLGRISGMQIAPEQGKEQQRDRYQNDKCDHRHPRL